MTKFFRLLAAMALSSCGSSSNPSGPIMINVTNATCSSGQCTSMQVVAHLQLTTPPPPGGWIVILGTVSSPSACLVIPASGTFNGTVGGTPKPVQWSTSNTFTLTGDNAAQPTREFVPDQAPGWSVTFPGGSLAPAAPCSS